MYTFDKNIKTSHIVMYQVDHSVSLGFFFYCFCFVLFADLLKQMIQVHICILQFYTEEDRNVKSLQITIDTK